MENYEEEQIIGCEINPVSPNVVSALRKHPFYRFKLEEY